VAAPRREPTRRGRSRSELLTANASIAARWIGACALFQISPTERDAVEERINASQSTPTRDHFASDAAL